MAAYFAAIYFAGAQVSSQNDDCNSAYRSEFRLTSDAAERAAAALLDARLHRRWLHGLPDGCVPQTCADAFAIQQRVADRMGPVAGFKAGVDRASPVFASVLHASPARVPAASMRLFGVEMEFGFSFARDLPPRSAPYSESEVTAAVGAVHAAIEIVESRFADLDGVDELSKLADNGSNEGVVVGPAYADWRAVDLAQVPVRLLIDGKEAACAVGGNRGKLSLPSLLWLVNNHAPRYGGIRRGQIAITGSFTGITIAHAGATVVADLGSLGQATVVYETASR
jgi:2-keto-4-pentenoate hydratase